MTINDFLSQMLYGIHDGAQSTVEYAIRVFTSTPLRSVKRHDEIIRKECLMYSILKPLSLFLETMYLPIFANIKNIINSGIDILPNSVFTLFGHPISSVNLGK
jgi:hypothetical protein